MTEKKKNKGMPSFKPLEDWDEDADVPPPPLSTSGSPRRAEDYIPKLVGLESPEPEPPLDVPLHPAFIAFGREALKALEAASPDAAADERILHRLVADQLAITSALFEAQAQLTGRVRLLLDQPKTLVAVVRVLNDVVRTTNAVSRRIEGALGVAANLRAQRRFFSNHSERRPVDGS